MCVSLQSIRRSGQPILEIFCVYERFKWQNITFYEYLSRLAVIRGGIIHCSSDI